MLASTKELFESITTPPGVVTVATSRVDAYTPEPQHNLLNELTLKLIEEVCKSKSHWGSQISTCSVVRKDFRSPLSSDDSYDPLAADNLSESEKRSSVAQLLSENKCQTIKELKKSKKFYPSRRMRKAVRKR